MNCPYCSRPMVSGYVQAAREVYFTEVEHTYLFKAKKNKDVLLTHDNWTAPTCRANLCPDCKKVIIDYESNPE